MALRTTDLARALLGHTAGWRQRGRRASLVGSEVVACVRRSVRGAAGIGGRRSAGVLACVSRPEPTGALVLAGCAEKSGAAEVGDARCIRRGDGRD